jgi:hypothetical protein
MLLLGASVLGNVGLAYFVIKLRKSKRKDQTPRYDVSAQDLIHDVTRRGQAVVRMEVLDPSAFFLRSPRQ